MGLASGECALDIGDPLSGGSVGRSSGLTGDSGSVAAKPRGGTASEWAQAPSGELALLSACLHVMTYLSTINYYQRRALFESHLKEVVGASIIFSKIASISRRAL